MMSLKKIRTGRRPVIILTGGGSGGHITPILSLAHELRRQRPDYQLVYVGLRGQKISIDEKVFDHVEYVSSGKLRRFSGRGGWRMSLNPKNWLLNIRDGFRVLAGLRQARRLMRRYRPALVFSKGGYVAVPVGWAAHRAAVPLITHDSDVVPGLANRLIGRWAQWHAVGWPADNYDYPTASLRYTGIPLNPSIKPASQKLKAEYRRQLGYGDDDLILLVGGAGLGSGTLNDLTLAAAPRLLAKYPTLKIVHLTGRDHLDEVTQAYAQLPAGQRQRIKAMSFSDKFYIYSTAADLIVSRAGATSIAEFAAQAKACLLIPASWLPGGQQSKNAAIVAAAKAAVIADNDISPAEYTDLVSRLLNDQRYRTDLGRRLHGLVPANGAQQVAELIIQTIEGSQQHEA